MLLWAAKTKRIRCGASVSETIRSQKALTLLEQRTEEDLVDLALLVARDSHFPLSLVAARHCRRRPQAKVPAGYVMAETRGAEGKRGEGVSATVGVGASSNMNGMDTPEQITWLPFDGRHFGNTERTCTRTTTSKSATTWRRSTSRPGWRSGFR